MKLFDGKNTLILFKQAVHAVRADKFRKGDVILLPPEGDIVISADMHGDLDNFEKIQEISDLENNPNRHVIIHELIHNLYSKGKDRSYDILKEAVEWKVKYPNNVHMIIANHDLCEIDETPIRKDGKEIKLVFSDSTMRHLGKYGDKIRETCKQYLSNLPIGVRTASRLWISHSIPQKFLNKFNLSMFMEGMTLGGVKNRMDAYRREIIHDLVWGRDFSEATAKRFAEKVKADNLIIGHERAVKGYLVPNSKTIILDSIGEEGCFIYLKLNKKYKQEQIVKNIRKIDA